jgi:hypothetical protein
MTASEKLPRIPIDDYAELIEDYRVCRDALRKWEKDREEIVSKIKKVLGDEYAVGTINDVPVTTYTSYTKRSVDGEWLKEKYPEIWLQSLNYTPTSRLTVTDR